MRTKLMIFLLIPALAFGWPSPEDLATIREASIGRIAHCMESEVDELQVIGEVRRLTKEETQAVGAILGALESYAEKQPDGTYRGLSSMCMPYWDFKLLLYDPKKGSGVAIRLCSSCRQVSLTLDGTPRRGVTMLQPGFERLSKLLDTWFPGWPAVSAANKRKRERHERGALDDKKPNKAPEPTPGSVTPRATSGNTK